MIKTHHYLIMNIQEPVYFYLREVCLFHQNLDLFLVVLICFAGGRWRHRYWHFLPKCMLPPSWLLGSCLILDCFCRLLTSEQERQDSRIWFQFSIVSNEKQQTAPITESGKIWRRKINTNHFSFHFRKHLRFLLNSYVVSQTFNQSLFYIGSMLRI